MPLKIDTYEFTEIIQATPDVKIFKFKPVIPETKIFNYKPGQFLMMYMLDSEGKPTNLARAYSISSNPIQKDHLELTIKITGKFTNMLDKMKVGDRVGVTGSFGVFTYNTEKHKDTVMMAGGVGIAPFISMVRFSTAQKLQNKIFLFYSNRTNKDISHLEELKRLEEENPNFRAIYTVTRDEPASGIHEQGRFNETHIQKYLPALEGKNFMLCGSTAMVNDFTAILQALGVEKFRITAEKFG
ncbi:MAG: FAD-dependent oxidoreductase [Candidatus Aenigmarchaeota archaeon]|nr:FAD-dependent oxidoreductase [Candidatus Aenigmarchaeota archaeon]